eukprot:m.788368 g.788368  ORF g.788368 m.788368 type:complete len:128 (-) comp23316_c0_seq9:289-672(-)
MTHVLGGYLAWWWCWTVCYFGPPNPCSHMHVRWRMCMPQVVLSYGHQRPAMVGEMYALDVCVTSEETVNMTDVSLVVKVLEDGDGAPSTIGTVAVAAAEGMGVGMHRFLACIAWFGGSFGYSFVPWV